MANLHEDKKYHFTYKTINLVNERYYLGMHSTNKLSDSYLGSGTRLWREIRKYNKENFKTEILQYYNSRSELIEAEKQLITNEDIKNKNCLNLKPGGNGGGCSKEHYELMRKNSDLKRKENWKKLEYREKKCKEFSERMKRRHELGEFRGEGNNKGFLDKKHTKETKEIIGLKNSIHQTGHNNSQYGTCWVYNIGLRESKRIKSKEETTYLCSGWLRGRKIKW